MSNLNGEPVIELRARVAELVVQEPKEEYEEPTVKIKFAITYTDNLARVLPYINRKDLVLAIYRNQFVLPLSSDAKAKEQPTLFDQPAADNESTDEPADDIAGDSTDDDSEIPDVDSPAAEPIDDWLTVDLTRKPQPVEV